MAAQGIPQAVWPDTGILHSLQQLTRCIPRVSGHNATVYTAMSGLHSHRAVNIFPSVLEHLFFLCVFVCFIVVLIRMCKNTHLLTECICLSFARPFYPIGLGTGTKTIGTGGGVGVCVCVSSFVCFSLSHTY